MKNVLLAIFFVAFTMGAFAQQQSVFTAKKLDVVHSNFNQHQSKAVVDSLHYDGDSDNSIGTGAAASFGVYAYWPTESITEFDGNVISQLKVYLPQPENMASAQIEIHHDQTSGAIYTQEFTPVLGWNVIDLVNPMPISSTQDFYIGYSMEATGGYPAGCDAGPIAASGNGNWIVMGGSWDHLNDLASTLTYNWNIRAMVAETAGLDLAVKSLDLGGISTDTDYVVAGSLQNMGETSITSFDINYQVNDGDLVTMNMTDVDIASWEVYPFEYPEIWTAEPGKYDVTVTISNINGGDDENVANNSLTKRVVIASGSTTMMPVYEHFTASTCPPCATINSTIFSPQFIEDNIENATVIRYQVNWPGAGDPYYTNEVGVRVGYYGVGAVPTVFLNGSTETMSSTAQLQSNLDVLAAQPAYFELNATHAVSPGAQSIELDVDVTPYITDDGYTVHAVVIENETTGNVGTNGETEFQHVTMKMVPNANGTQVDFVDGEVESLQFTADLSGTFIEEYTDLSVVVFVQKDASKAVMQSTYSVGASIETYAVNFSVTDGVNAHEGATITIAGAELTTDAVGFAAIELSDGTYPYTAEIDGYSTVEDEVVVAGSAVGVDVVLGIYNVNFTITADGNGVEGALITIGANELTTNADGFATIELVNGFYPFTIAKEGYDNIQDVVVVADADMDINLSFIGVTSFENASLTVYPNPSNGVFTISVDGTYDVQVLNNLGQIVHVEKVESNKVLDLSGLVSGVYVLTVKNDSKFATQNIIIK